MQEILLRLKARLRRRLVHAGYILQQMLLTSILPALGWGPFVHPYINRRAPAGIGGS